MNFSRRTNAPPCESKRAESFLVIRRRRENYFRYNESFPSRHSQSENLKVAKSERVAPETTKPDGGKLATLNNFLLKDLEVLSRPVCREQRAGFVFVLRVSFGTGGTRVLDQDIIFF